MGKPNPQNLKVPTSEEARRNGAKGGKASGEARRRRKTMKDLFEQILMAENEDPASAKGLKRLGYEETDNVHMAKIVTAVIKKAEDGDLKAVDTIAKLLYGDQQNLSVNIEGSLETQPLVQIYLPERDIDPE